MEEPKAIKQPDIITAIVTTDIPEQADEQKDEKKLARLDYIPFGTDNLYPQALASLYRKSVALRGIVNSQVTYTSAGGIQLDSNDSRALELVEQANSKGQSLTEVFENAFLDKRFSGNGWIEIVTNRERSMLSFFHVQSVKCRYAKGKKACLIHPNWQDYKKAHLTDGTIKAVPMYPEFEEIDGFHRSMIHIADYEPDFDNYGIPPYIAAMDSAAIGYKTNKWNVSRLDNAFQTSGVLVVDGEMTTDDAKKLKEEFKKEMTGEGNQGNILMIIKKLGGEGTEFTPINSNTEGDWIQLHNQSNDDLILANGWKKSLAGITESSGFDTDRILNDYQVVKSTFIVREQTKFIKLISGVAKQVAGIDLEGLSFKNEPPVSLLTKLTGDYFVRKWEARKEAGLEFDSEDPNQMKYIDSSETTTVEENTSNKTIEAIKKFIKG